VLQGFHAQVFGTRLGIQNRGSVIRVLNLESNMKSVSLAKYHCYGNDYLVALSGQIDEEEYPKFASAVCSPHFGIGSDGCVFVKKQSARFFLRLFNPDGSEFGVSGNGVRCVAAFLHHRELAEGPEIHFETPSGLRRYLLVREGQGEWRYRSWMGKPDFSPSSVGCRIDSDSPVLDQTLSVAGQDVKVNAVYVGNPQCVVYTPSITQDEFQRLGAGLEGHDFFPKGTNVSFVSVQDKQSMRIRVWERGVGPTESSGTGSCGAAVMSIYRKLVESPVTVETETGCQIVAWTQGREIELLGDCCFVADVNFCWRTASY
jgi:diaminopimelate epimerase